MQHWIAWYTDINDEEGIGDTYFGPFFTEGEAQHFIDQHPPEMYGTWNYAETYCVNSPHLIEFERRQISE